MENEFLFQQQMLDLRQGDHLCLIYDEDPLEQMPSLVPFIKNGLENDEQFVYIADDITLEQLSFILKINGIDVKAENDRGALKLWTRKEWRQPGELDSAKKSEQVRGIINDAFKAGFKGIRFAVEMTWTLGPDISVEKLEHWEATINTIFTPGFPGKIICQYSRHRLSAPVINQAFRTHPLAIIENCLCHNAFYVDTLNVKDKPAMPNSDWMIPRLKESYLGAQTRKAECEHADYKNVEWGTHVCSFYKSKKDLLELLIPYLRAGLENNEMCIWITSEALSTEEARKAAGKSIANFDAYINNGQIEILDARNWYTHQNKFKPVSELLNKWVAKEQESLSKGFKGLRIIENTSWLRSQGWERFYEFESRISTSIHKYKIIFLCSYSLKKCSPADIIEITSAHQSTFINKNSRIMRIKNSEYKKAEKLLIEGYRELENKINERTAELSKSLEEKEVLLKEIHHRVKNNMQVISSLIRLQSAKLEDERAVKVLEECQNRIKSMALVHKALYSSNDFSTLNLGDYIKSLGNELFSFYNIDSKKIKIDVDVKDISLDMDTSIACGLILSELVTNSIKYAFPDERSGKINVGFEICDNEAKLRFSDDGVGIPHGFDVDNCNTLGIRLVKTLVTQLEGKLQVRNRHGTSFQIEFPIGKVE